METRPLLPINQLTSTFVSAIVCIRLGCTPRFGMHIQTGLFSVSFGMHVHSVLHTHTDEFAHQGIRLARSRIRTGELFDLSIVCIYQSSVIIHCFGASYTRKVWAVFSFLPPHFGMHVQTDVGFADNELHWVGHWATNTKGLFNVHAVEGRGCFLFPL